MGRHRECQLPVRLRRTHGTAETHCPGYQRALTRLAVEHGPCSRLEPSAKETAWDPIVGDKQGLQGGVKRSLEGDREGLGDPQDELDTINMAGYLLNHA